MKKSKNIYRLSKRGELLSIRVKNKIDQLKNSVPRPASGIPLNALPGWADVPLYEKLPMLDCPNNQIVFTNSKIGRGLPRFSSEYDTNCKNDVNEYNSLNDPHLRNFYSRERNLDLLKKYGIITKDNYVICNLYEFNAYRRLLNRFHLFLIHKELDRREGEQEDRAMIVHAEAVAEKEYQKRMLKADYCDPVKVKKLKQKHFQDKMERFKLNLKNLDEKFTKIQKFNDLKSVILKQKAKLHQVAIEQRQLIANDILRKNIIATIKHLKTVNDLSAKHIKQYKENQLTNKLDKKSIQWDKRIKNTIERHKKNTALMIENEALKHNNIQRRIQTSKRQWQHIQRQIAENSKSKSFKNKNISIDEKFSKTKNMKRCLKVRDFSISKLNCKDIEDAVHTAIDLQEDSCNTNPNDSIYEAAKYIIEQILANIDYDLNDNEEYRVLVTETVKEIFKKVKEAIIQKVKIVLKDLDILKCSKNEDKASYARSVSFCDFSPIIGISALQEEYMFCGPINIKSVKERAPTPAGSLTSFTVVFDNDNNINPSSEGYLPHKERKEKIFIGHFLIKFKRHLLVGVSQKVFQKLKYCNELGDQLNPKELLDVDNEYLVNEVSKSILGYGTNKYNFYGILRLCTSCLSTKILKEVKQDPSRVSKVDDISTDMEDYVYQN